MLNCNALFQTKCRKEPAHTFICSVLQCVAVRCSVLQCVAVCCSALHCVKRNVGRSQHIRVYVVCCSVLQYVAVYCSMLQCAALCQTKCWKEPAHIGWLRLVGSFKLHISFAKKPYKRDDILLKRPIILRSLLFVANTYVHI